MIKNYRNFFYILILVFTVSFSVYLQRRPKIPKRPADSPGFEHLTHKLIDILAIKPGMTILNIGTGSGLAAFKFAEELKGTGKVYATDVKPELIKYVTEEARKRGLTNLYPVLVKKGGVDDFYSRQKYDLIIMFHLFFQLKNRENYLKKMRSLLNENGRLILGLNKSIFPFLPKDITDAKGLIEELSREPHDSPFYKGLGKSTKELLNENISNKSDELLKKIIVKDFNNILSNINFSVDFLKDGVNGLEFKGNVSFSSQESLFVSWLLMKLKEHTPGDINYWLSLVFPFIERKLDFNKRKIRKTERLFVKLGQLSKTGELNKLLIIQRFRKYLYGGKKSMDSRAYTSIGGSKYSLIKSTVIQAGFKFENEYDFIPFVGLLVFRI